VQPTHAFRALRLFTGSDVLSPGFIVLSGDRIAAVSGGAPADDVASVDLGDATILPGLIDAHSHLSIVPGEGDQIGQMRRPLNVQLAAARSNVARDLASGVTTMRVMGEELGVDFHVRDEIRRGVLDGPDLLCAGVQIAREGQHGHAITGVRDEAEIEALARQNIDRGADLLKIFATGGVSSEGTAQDAVPFTTQEIQRAADTAHAHGLRLAAHTHGGEGARRAIEGGVDTIEHGAALDDELIDAIVRRSLMVVGTFSILFHPEGIEQGDGGRPDVMAKVHRARVTVERAWRAVTTAGMRCAVGTDSMHGRLAYDVAKLVEFGATPFAALQAATVRGAEACGLTDRGCLEPGLRADVVVVRGNPLDDIMSLSAPELVIAGGRIVHQRTKFPVSS